MAIEAGRVLSERYRLIRPVGQGSQASVWVAEHLALTTHVAVKLIDQELAKKETARERFRREATAAAQLRSAHVVQILDHGIDGDQPFIVMELLDGEDLFERLAHRTRLSLKETSKIVTQVARALSRAHQAGIVHRDLKPENVFLVPNEDDEIVKVLDFGVAKIKTAPKSAMKATGVGTLIGTPHYMSPEQVKGISEVDYRTDLWALGVIAFQCVTGELPFDSEGVGDLLIKISLGTIPVPSKVYPGVAPSFDAWYAKACAREPEDRFQSAREMAVALAAAVGGNETMRAPTMRPPAATAADPHELETDDFEEVFDEPAPPRASPSVRPVKIGHEMVDFDETIPATGLDLQKLQKKVPPPRPSGAGAPVPPAAPSVRTSVKSLIDASPTTAIAPVMIPAARISQSSSSGPGPSSSQRVRVDEPAPAPPRPTPVEPAPVSRPAPVSARVNEGPPPRLSLNVDPPAELSGSKRKTLITILVAGLILGALGVTWTVVKSQLDQTPDPVPSAPTATVTPIPTAAPQPTAPTAAVSAIDPGKSNKPPKPAWTAAPKGTGRLPRPKGGHADDGTIVIPDPPSDDSVPPAP